VFVVPEANTSLVEASTFQETELTVIPPGTVKARLTRPLGMPSSPGMFWQLARESAASSSAV
jgi:hypothetical protein